MNQAAKLLLHIIGNGTWMGMVHFDSSAYIKSQLIQIISTKEREMLSNLLPTVADEGTSICTGIQLAFQVKFLLLLWLFGFFKRFYLFIFNEGEGREKGMERNVDVRENISCLSYMPLPIPNPQPRRVC